MWNPFRHHASPVERQLKELTEWRESLENPAVPISSAKMVELYGMDSLADGAPEPVTIDSAMGVPAIGCAVNFLALTMSSMPLELTEYDSATGNYVVVPDAPDGGAKGRLVRLIGHAINDQETSSGWRKYSFTQQFTGGRQYSFIERNTARRIVNLWPLDPDQTTVKRKAGRVTYHYRENGRTIIYDAADIIDLSYMLKPDGLQHRSPIWGNKVTISKAIALEKYGAKFFHNGGVPPFVIEGPINTPGGVERSANDMHDAVMKAARQNRAALALPAGHTLKSIGANPEQMQMVEALRFSIEQFARIWDLPPVFLQDLTHGTLRNSEQQDLHLVKHRIIHLVTEAEQQYNLKLFGRDQTRLRVKYDVDGLLRGDFRTRMEGFARAIQGAIMKPNEVRIKLNLPTGGPAGDQLYLQGGTFPLGTAPLAGQPPAPPPADPTPDDDPDPDPDEEDDNND